MLTLLTSFDDSRVELGVTEMAASLGVHKSTASRLAGALERAGLLTRSGRRFRLGLEVVRLWGWGFPFYSPLYRTVAEWLPGGPPAGPVSSAGQAVAALLYQLYRLNWPGRGDVLSAVARRP